MRIGILIIGSLYWDEQADRCRWRRDRLDCSGKRTVRVPIRYGRKSTTRGNTYTMVFARSCASADKLGTGLVVPARAECRYPEHLVEEAECLWAAERNSSDRDGIARNWGRVCLLPAQNRPLRKEFQCAWQTAVHAAGSQYREVPAATEEKPLLDRDSGIAQFEWPTDAEAREPLSGFDLLLLTATEPTLTNNARYPSARNVAKAWRADMHGNVSYFYKNRRHGITTADDDEILRALSDGPTNNVTDP